MKTKFIKILEEEEEKRWRISKVLVTVYLFSQVEVICCSFIFNLFDLKDPCIFYVYKIYHIFNF